MKLMRQPKLRVLPEAATREQKRSICLLEQRAGKRLLGRRPRLLHRGGLQLAEAG